MTKRRTALTFENALWTVAQSIGWPRVAAIVGLSERTVRNWSEPDTSAGITLDAAYALDCAHAEAVGAGTPFLACYATKVDVDGCGASSAREVLIECAAKAAKENGEAIAGALDAARPGAGKSDIERAELELEESIRASTALLAQVRAQRGDRREPLLQEVRS